ncbi:GntR family transcriptional regulator [Starkeya koreensis]|uniref:GntR family transcriptional regulator n=1 Tax=Ancylobacter koreensis TaxID=266121 RepID=A0ABT0DR23_9HYPH|nr:GntR family transcriptional regulator [Ancylobacter koreensis]MCK0209721.1 GntR family transcriptional regulator [Ancylobacter koreensis]
MARKPDTGAENIVPLKAVKPASLAALAYDQVYTDIMNGSLEPGRKLLVADLHAAYGIGLSPLRDALNRLCADGLVRKHEQKGFFVADLDEAELLEITNVRLVLEETALRLSILHGDTAWEERIVIAFYRLSKAASTDAGDYLLTPAWSSAHQEFHFALLEACRNDWLIGFCRKLYEQLTRYRARRRSISAMSSPLRTTLVQEHKDILDACLARNADEACRLLVEHYKRSFELVVNTKFRLLENPLRLETLDPRPEEGRAKGAVPADTAAPPRKAGTPGGRSRRRS